AEYRPFRINRIIGKSDIADENNVNDDLRVFELDGIKDFSASQFAFLWIPGVGEKPFSIVWNKPLTFLIRKKEYDPGRKKGLVSHALFLLKKGDTIMVRGVYGKGISQPLKKNIYILAGGTGAALIPGLVQHFSQGGNKITIFLGVKNDQELNLINNEIISKANTAAGKYSECISVPDNGKSGRVLDIFYSRFTDPPVSLEEISDSVFYNMGPAQFMKKAGELERDLGATPNVIYFALETNTMCGIGLCGECVCGEKRTCKDGTFLSLKYLEKHSLDIALNPVEELLCVR
ncbi:MAG: hypothetical protein AB1798_18825, partial [Spirochaetota bacterium]